jgi:hypothetical protein
MKHVGRIVFCAVRIVMLQAGQKSVSEKFLRVNESELA